MNSQNIENVVIAVVFAIVIIFIVGTLKSCEMEKYNKRIECQKELKNKDLCV